MIIFDEEEQYLKLQQKGFEKFINTKDLTILAKHYLYVDKTLLDQVKGRLIEFCAKYSPSFRPIKYDKQLNNAINLAVRNYKIYNSHICFTKEEMEYIQSSDLILWEQKLLFILHSLSKWVQLPYIYLNSDSVIQIRDLRAFLGVNLKDKDVLDLLHSLHTKRKIKANLKPILKIDLKFFERVAETNTNVLEFDIRDDFGLYFNKFNGEKIFQCERCGKLFIPAKKARYAKYCKFCLKKES